MAEKLIDYEDHIVEALQDPEFLQGYLNEVLKEEDLPTFLLALKYIAKSKRGGITEFAKKAGFSRQTLYKTLSAKGNPTFKNLNIFLKTAGFHLKVEADKPARKTKQKSKKHLVVT